MNPRAVMDMIRRFMAARPMHGQGDANMPINPQMTPQSESLRRMMTLSLFGAGVVCTIGATLMVLIIWLGGWTDDTQAQRLEILAYALIGMLAGILAVIISFAIGGPVGRLRGSVGIASFDASSAMTGPMPPSTQVTTTTTVAGPPPVAPSPSPPAAADGSVVP